MDRWKLSALLMKGLMIPPEKKNLGTRERIISSAVGGLLCTLSMRKKGSSLLMVPAGYFFYRALTGYCPITASFGWDSTEGAESFAMKIAVTVNRPYDQVYTIWRDLESLPKYLKHIKSVKKTDEKTYEWVAEFGGQDFRWNAEILEDLPNRRITWKSVEPTDVENYGTVEFIDLPGTGMSRMRFLMIYRPAKTELGALVATMLTPIFRQKVKDDIRRFRDMMDIISKPGSEMEPGIAGI